MNQQANCINSAIIIYMKDRMFEITLFTFGIVGLFLLFTAMYVGPRFIFGRITELIGA